MPSSSPATNLRGLLDAIWSRLWQSQCSNHCFMTDEVCALLHLYNSLRNLERPIQSIKLPDQLCQVILQELFNRALPTGTFTSQYRRALGGTMSRNYGEKKQWSSRLVLPTTFNPQKGISSTLSMFYELHNIHYVHRTRHGRGVSRTQPSERHQEATTRNIRTNPCPTI
jgi:hypothetical protein